MSTRTLCTVTTAMTTLALSTLSVALDGFPTAVLCPDNESIIVAGSITAAGGIPVQNVSRWNGTTWEAMGSLPPNVHLLAVDRGGNLHAAGSMGIVDGTVGARVKRWTGSRWSSIEADLDGEVRSMFFMPDHRLAAVGTFTRAGTLGLERLAFWGGREWCAGVYRYQRLRHHHIHRRDQSRGLLPRRFQRRRFRRHLRQ